MVRLKPQDYNEHAEEEPGLPCKDKLAFDTKREAQATANVAHYRYGGSMHAYVCRHCNLWHLASGPAD